MIDATTTLGSAANSPWDIVVVGSGLAGSVAALELARRNLRVLMLDQKSFPRNKPCGGCLNAEALHHLKGVGVLDTIEALGGEPYSRFDLWNGRRHLSLSLPPGLGLSRYSLDAALIRRAIEAGADFLPTTSAQIQPVDTEHEFRTIQCRRAGESLPIQTKLVLLATGLSGNPLRNQPQFDFATANNSRIGVQATISDVPDFPKSPSIHMAVGRSGYVGLARIESGLINLAAAITPSALQDGSPADVCRKILTDSGVPFSADIPAESWQGTVGLTRTRNKLADERLFVVGDAAGYVEPFTGEGMATALRGARAVTDLAESAVRSWEPRLIDQWTLTMRRDVIRRWPCNMLTRLLRVPLLVRLAMGATVSVPVLGRTVIRSINREKVDEQSNAGAWHRRTC